MQHMLHVDWLFVAQHFDFLKAILRVYFCGVDKGKELNH